ncbi:MAG TPA: VOC family protein [Mycobacteriales bacterium]|nr:VOC family protein [Mycobacteriales bacterium]
MSPWPGPISAVTLFVEDLDAARSFYRDVLGVAVHYEDRESVVFAFGSTLVNLLVTAAAPELIEPATVAAQDSGNRFQLTVDVDDVDAMCERLTARGVALLNGPINRPWGVRTASFRDPAGHIWELAQPTG